MSKFTEKQIKEYAITIINEVGEINTSELHESLRLRMKPDGEDLIILKNRADDRFSQKVRNLVSHLSSSNSLEHFVIVDKSTSPTTFRTRQFDNFKTITPDLQIVKETLKKKKDDSRKYSARIIDYSKHQLENKKLGDAGERFYFKIEKDNVLKEFGKAFVNEVIYTAKVDGDGAGYDILSYSKHGIKHIEVKTTKYDLKTAFYMSYNEKAFMDSHLDTYYLVRIYNFDLTKNTGEYRVYRGPEIETTFNFDTFTYKVSLKEV